ncbi:MAG: hypothetical protein RIR49_829 [Actinomycetota bacterium]
MVATIAVVAVAGVLLRWWALTSPLGFLNADEAYTGLQAARILEGDIPIVMRGFGYTATLEAYVLAPVVAVLGNSVILLKASQSLWWAIAAIATGAAATAASGRRWAGGVAAGVVWVGCGPILEVSLRSYPGYGTGYAAVAITLWLAVLTVGDRAPTHVGRRTLHLLYGMSAGLALYSHPMFVAVIAPILLVSTLRHRGDVRGYWVPTALGGLIVNLPFLAWNARNSWPSLTQPSPEIDPYLTRLGRFFSGLLPRTAGMRTPDGTWVLGLGPSVIVLGGLIALVVFGARRLWLADRWVAATLILPGVIGWPLLAGFSNMWWVVDARYAIVLLPVLVVPLATGLTPRRRTGDLRSVAFGVTAAVTVVAVTVLPWMLDRARPVDADPNATTREIVRLLDEADVSNITGNFWLTNPVEYVSDLRIRAGVAGHPWGALFDWNPGRPYGVRFSDTQTAVMAADPTDRAYVFLPGDQFLPADQWEDVLALPADRYSRHDLPGAILYVPDR